MKTKIVPYCEEFCSKFDFYIGLTFLPTKLNGKKKTARYNNHISRQGEIQKLIGNRDFED